MEKIKIGFVDFWGDGFDRENNYFTNLLRTKYEVQIDQADPDLLFFTVGYGGDLSALNYKHHKGYSTSNCATQIFLLPRIFTKIC